MMTTKGTTMIVLPAFILQKFGEDALKKWLDSLSPESKQIFSNIMVPSAIHPLQTGLIEPTMKMCELFYGGDIKGAVELGRFSADYALKGIYKFFMKLGNPQFIIKKASSILPTYYQPSKMEAVDVENGHATLRITEFPEMHEIVEKRIIGWMERAMEMTGAKNGKFIITKSFLRGDNMTEFSVKWD